MHFECVKNEGKGFYTFLWSSIDDFYGNQDFILKPSLLRHVCKNFPINIEEPMVLNSFFFFFFFVLTLYL